MSEKERKAQSADPCVDTLHKQMIMHTCRIKKLKITTNKFQAATEVELVSCC